MAPGRSSAWSSGNMSPPMTASPRPAPHNLGSCAATPPAITSPHSKPAVRSTALPERARGPRRHSVRCAQTLAFDLGGGAAEAALALLEEGERLEVVALAEVGPQGVGHVHLGVRELPEEEVAEAHLAAGADQEVGIRDVAGAEVPGERAGGDPFRGELAAPDAPRDGARGARDLLAPAVADGEDHGHTGVASGCRDGGA